MEDAMDEQNLAVELLRRTRRERGVSEAVRLAEQMAIAAASFLLLKDYLHPKIMREARE
jgi:hypothetical protein